MSIVANRYPKVRAALCHDHFTAQMSREHNDANILVMGERVIGKGVALEIVKTWLETEFAGGRHQLRLNKIARSESVRNRLSHGATEPRRRPYRFYLCSSVFICGLRIFF